MNQRVSMVKVFITGSSDGIGLRAAKILADRGHQITLHARNENRAKDAMVAVPKAQGCLIGDLSSLADVKKLAQDANKAGPWDAVIHNAGLGPSAAFQKTEDNIAATFAVNSLAPYILTFLMDRPKRLLYLSSSLHKTGNPKLEDLTWTKRSWNSFQAYCDSKLHNVLLANAVARLRPEVQTCSLDPGYVKTKMAGSGAPGTVERPAMAIAAFASGEETYQGKSGLYLTTGGIAAAKAEAGDVTLQDRFLQACADLSGVPYKT